MPQTASSSQNITNIANQLCDTGDGDNHLPPTEIGADGLPHRSSRVGFDELPQQFLICLNETVDKASEVRRLMLEWKLMFPRRNQESILQQVTQVLQIPRGDCNTFDAEQTSRLYVFIQISSFACFLKNQENDTAYGDKQEHIQKLQFKILEMGRILRKLISLDDDTIKNYVMSGNANNTLTLDICVPAVRRVVCCTVVELLLNILEKIDVSVTASSIDMV